MKAKLNTIREALVETTGSFGAAVAFDSLPKDVEIITNGNTAIQIIDALIAELDSPEMVDKLTWAICPKMKEWSNAKDDRDYECKKCVPWIHAVYGECLPFCRRIAQDATEIAINAIKGESAGDKL